MIANAKRTRLEKENVHSWHPYYAGYSENFVHSILEVEKANLNYKPVILDPWVGSGTTGVVCQKMGYDCIGVDVNQAMVIFSSAKNHSLLRNTCDLESTFTNIMNRAKRTRKKLDTSNLHEIVSKELASKLIRILISIEEEFQGLNDDSSLAEKSFFKAVLMIANRQLMGYRSGSNPTWFKKTEPNQKISFKKIEEACYKNLVKMLSDLKATFSNENFGKFRVMEASSTNLPIKEQSIDLVISSPPYLTRIDYAVSTQVELLLLTGKFGYRQTREKTIGTTTIYSELMSPQKVWGHTCNKVIEAIQNHSSYSSQTYYIKNKTQYFDSSYKSLSELYRVMKTGASAYLVIQNSYYKEIAIDLPTVYREMAEIIGFSSTQSVRKDDLKVTMASINSKSKKYTNNKHYYEEIIRIIK